MVSNMQVNQGYLLLAHGAGERATSMGVGFRCEMGLKHPSPGFQTAISSIKSADNVDGPSAWKDRM